VTDGFERKMFEVYGTDENFERLRRAQELGQRHDGTSAGAADPENSILAG